MAGAAASGVAWLDVVSAIAQRGGVEINPTEVRNGLTLLEKDAATSGLVTVHRSPLPPLATDNVYLETLPRLVELVDRATVQKPHLADPAALLLSEINAQEAVPSVFYLQITGLRAPSPPFQSVRAEYQQMFDTMSVRPEHIGRVKWYADRLTANRPRYQVAATQTGVPWYVIGVIHALEASFNFLGHLHNGDVPLDRQTRHVPAGKPNPWVPPYTWERSAEDALRLEHFAGATDWSVPRIFYRLEGYNGFGYRPKKVNSPYLWSFSNQYDRGKYVNDGVWSASTQSQQCGAAVMIHELSKRGVLAI
jgi:lysozyme family protein